MMYGYGYGHALGFGLFGGILSLIFWVVVIWLIISLIRGVSGHHGGRGCWGGMCGHDHGIEKDSAMEVLRERYAKGEISKEEFEEKSQTLKK